MGWFAFGVLFNLRRGEAYLRWMQAGLPRVGERTTLRWLGTSVAELVIAKAKGPLRRLETLMVLAPRDIPWMWLIAALQGRRDTLIFRAQLGSPPPVSLELADPASWTGRMGLQEAERQGWEKQPYQQMQLMAPPGMLPMARLTLERIEPAARRLAPEFRRLGLHRDGAHLEVHLPFPDRQSTQAADFFEALQALARAVNERE